MGKITNRSSGYNWDDQGQKVWKIAYLLEQNAIQMGMPDSEQSISYWQKFAIQILQEAGEIDLSKMNNGS